MTPAGESAKAKPTSEAAPRLAKRLKRGIADGVLDYNGREETLGVWMTKAYWKELLAALEAPPAAERTALKERILALPIEWDEKRGYHLDEKDVAKAIDAQGVER